MALFIGRSKSMITAPCAYGRRGRTGREPLEVVEVSQCEARFLVCVLFGRAGIARVAAHEVENALSCQLLFPKAGVSQECGLFFLGVRLWLCAAHSLRTSPTARKETFVQETPGAEGQRLKRFFFFCLFVFLEVCGGQCSGEQFWTDVSLPPPGSKSGSNRAPDVPSPCI